jgi:hypothetical protein
LTDTTTTVVRGRWFPASVVLPDGRTLRKTYTLLAEGGDHAGLWVFTRPDIIEFRGAVNWLRQGEIPTGRRTRVGVDVQLTDGTVAVVTPGTECKCGALGRWAGPSWATNVAVRA